jgi:putative DNA primase/helicase
MGAPCDRWKAFMADIFPDVELRSFIQRAVGYSLLGLTSEQCFFLCYGHGANGKSVFLNTLLRLFGDYAAQVASTTFMAQSGDRIRADLARLRGVRFVSAIETGDGKRLDEAMVKAATGGEAIVAEHKYQAPFQFTPEFTLWLATNHRPRIQGTDYGIWRRVRLIPFTVTIPPEKQDRDLEQKLLREAEGILSWAVEGACLYLRDGLQAPEAVRVAVETYRTAEDSIGRFLADCTATGPTLQVAKGDLSKAYTSWAEREGEAPLSGKRLGLYIAERGFDEYRSGAARFWLGLGMQSGVND